MTTPGVLIAGRYRLRTRVASGGMGSVWEAQDEVLGRRVAVKLLLPQPGISPADAETARNRVIREARITARLHHPHAVTLYDVVEHAGQPCLIMQYVPSRSLNAILQERGVLPEQLTARIGAELASALTAAHLVGIVHRDVKPSNVLITHDGSAKLTDFGISHAAGDVNLTSTGMVSGTPAYLAPEVARGAASGFPADVFSLGATLYATLEGAPPFGTDVNPMAILHRVASGQIILPRRSGSLTPLLLHMLAPLPANRPTMADVTRALTAAVEGSRVPVEPERPTTSLPPPTFRDWPADPPAPTATLSDSLLGSRQEPDRSGAAPPIGRGAGAALTSPDRRRRPAVLLGAVLAIVLIGVVALGVAALAHRGRNADVATPTGTPGGSSTSADSTTPPSPTPSAAAVPLPATAATAASPVSSSSTTRSSTSPSRPATTPATRKSPPTSPAPSTTPVPSTSPAPPTSPSSPNSSSPSPSPSPSTRTTPSTSASRSTTASVSKSTSASPATGTPTGGQLAAALTDYYAGLPGGTDDGWAHLTANFRATTAQNRAYYQRFWDRVESVSVGNATGTAPGTVEATITYRFNDGRPTSVEDTRYQLVRSDGILKIDSSTVISSQ